MKYTSVLITVLLFLALQLNSQRIEVVPQISYAQLIENSGDNHVFSKLSSGFGYGLQVGVAPFRVGLDVYEGDLTYGNHFNGGGWSIYAKIRKYMLSLGYMPLDIAFSDFHITLGVEGSLLLSGSSEGKYSSWRFGGDSEEKDINDVYDSIHANFSLGPKARLWYDLNLSSGVNIRPQYSLYFGLTEEFQKPTEKLMAFRHYFGIGLLFELQKKKN